MLTELRTRIDDDEDGFTLIELMVVVLIIAILIAIAIPTFLGARERAQDRAAQSDIRNAFTAEKTVYTDDQAYTSATATLDGIEPSLTFASGATITDDNTSNGTVYVSLSGSVVYIGARSASGDCFILRDDPTGTTGTEYATDADCGDMTAATGWASEW